MNSISPESFEMKQPIKTPPLARVTVRRCRQGGNRKTWPATMLTIVVFAALATGMNLPAAEKLTVVANGKAVAVRYAIGAWKEVGDGLQSPGVSSTLKARTRQ